MAYELFSLNVDYAQNTASVVIRDEATKTHVHVNIKLETPGDAPESVNKQAAKDAARDALQKALAVL